MIFLPRGSGYGWVLFAFVFLKKTAGICRSRISWISAALPEAATQVQSSLLCVSWEDNSSSVILSFGWLSVRRFSSECWQEPQQRKSCDTSERKETYAYVYILKNTSPPAWQTTTEDIVLCVFFASMNISILPREQDQSVKASACSSVCSFCLQNFVYTQVTSPFP